jgi:hypothetical protein
MAAAEYGQLKKTVSCDPGTGCPMRHTLMPSACMSIGNGPNRLAAVALVTRIGPLTAHSRSLPSIRRSAADI